MSFVVRDGCAADHAYVYSAWLASYIDSPDVRGVSRERYFDAQHDRIERLIARSALRTAVDEDDAFVFYGFALVEGDCLHWLAVKQAFRRRGIARALVQPFTITRYSHRSRLLFPRKCTLEETARHGRAVLDPIPVPAGWRFDPYAVEKP